MRYGAWYARIGQSLWKDGSITYTLRHVDPEYRSLGKPFMRNDVLEHDLKYNQGLWKNQIRVEAFYKQNRDNLNYQNRVTNEMKGMGFRLGTHFKKWPNLTLSHTPYQMGNNHPDTLLNTRTQYAATNATLAYPYKFKKGYFFSLATFTKTTMDWGNGRLIGMSVFMISESLSWRQKLMLQGLFVSTRTNPGIDTANSVLTSVNGMYRWKPRVNLGGGLERVAYKFGGLKYGAYVQSNITVYKGYVLSLRVYRGHIQKLWGYTNKKVLEASAQLSIRW